MERFELGGSVLINSDNLEVLKSLPDNSIDSVVTDPPYGISFMSKKWDYDVPSIELWKEVLRVLKPGGHILVACGTRTQHRMVVNIEDAGFEIRDVISWVYGSGFPKSLNIGKAIDKIQGNEREVVGKWQPTGKARLVGGKNPDGIFTKYEGAELKGELELTKGNSEYEGWGTALKPACEFFTLARKPISETNIAENVLKWGTGGINIDECRVGEREKEQFTGLKSGTINAYGNYFYEKSDKPLPLGRFPANFIHDGSDEVVGLFPETSAPGCYPKGTFEKDSNCYGKYNGVTREERFTFDTGGSASRFFYCAKASPSERNEGLEGLEVKQTGTYAQDEWSRNNMGNSPDNYREPVANHHPTVKPIALMEYLIRLITPKGGIVLDPFAGSGTTGIAAINLKVNYILIEREAEYCTIADARLKHFYNKIQPDLFEAVNAF